MFCKLKERERHFTTTAKNKGAAETQQTKWNLNKMQYDGMHINGYKVSV